IAADHCPNARIDSRSEEHTSELQSLTNLVCRLLLEKKNKQGKPQVRRPSVHSGRDRNKPAPPAQPDRAPALPATRRQHNTPTSHPPTHAAHPPPARCVHVSLPTLLPRPHFAPPLPFPLSPPTRFLSFFFNDTATPEISTLSLHDALPISIAADHCPNARIDS